MAKVLKFIVHLIVFLGILSILALAVPPFVSITTIAIDDADQETNLPLGSVTYGKEIPGSDILIGDSIVVEDGNQAYRYRVQEIDLDNSMFTVLDTSNTRAEPKAITIRGNVTKVAITIGYIGYLLMAIQSTEGLIVIGLAVVFLVILFVLAEMWGRDKEVQGEEQDDAEDQKEAAVAAVPGQEDGEEKDPRQLKKEARARQKAEVARLKAEAKERRREEKEKLKAAKRIARTGGFIEDMEPVETILGLDGDSPAEQAADQAHEELKKEIEAATTAVSQEQSAEQEKMPTQEIPALDGASGDGGEKEQEEAKTEGASAEEGTQSEAPEPEKEEVPAKIAIPLYTAEELLEKAKAAGEDPEVVQDEETGVTLLDYSSIIGGKSGDSE